VNRRPVVALLVGAGLLGAGALSASCGGLGGAADGGGGVEGAATTVVTGELTIGDAYIGSYGAHSGAAYLRISNGGGEDRLTSVTSPDADTVEPMGAMSADGSSTEAGNDLLPQPIPSDGAVVFEPGGAHLMVSDLADPLEPGTAVTLRLTFEHAPAVDVTAEVVDVADIPDLMARS